jgi:hypothetical protein
MLWDVDSCLFVNLIGIQMPWGVGGRFDVGRYVEGSKSGPSGIAQSTFVGDEPVYLIS